MHWQPLIIPIKESGDLYMLAESYRFYLDTDHFSEDFYFIDAGQPRSESIYFTFEIPDGFRYDGASVPRWLWSLSGLGRDGLHRAAALVHDYIYIKKGNIRTIDGREVKITRKNADEIFRAMLKDAAIANHRVKLAYWSVRALGGLVWNK